MSIFKLVIINALAGCVAAHAVAQGFNVDIDMPGEPPTIGGGVPSSGFGAASGQAGFWNSLPTIHQGTLPLFDLSGNPTGVQETMFGGQTDLGYAFTGNTGDYALLLNDGVRVGDLLTYTITGLAPGNYEVFTYSAKPNGQYGEADIGVSGSTGPQRVSGIMPGNRFQYLLTHSIHDTQVTDGTLVISVTGPWPNAFVNGFQIVPVPEPCTVLALSVGVAALVSRRRRVRP